ncbi:MAG: DUF3617 domain-containing protein [Caulobacterales bacterium]
MFGQLTEAGAVPGLRMVDIAALAAAVIASAPVSLAQDDAGVPIAADDAPHMKPGLWTHTQVVNGGPSMTETYCDAGRSLAPPRSGDCSKYELRRTAAGAVVAEAVCKDISGQETRRSLTYEGDFAAHFTMSGDISTTVHGQTLWVVGGDEFQYLGPCSAGMKAQG